jgi:ribonuclease HI
MPRLFVDANPRSVAFVLDGGDSGYENLPAGYTSMEAEYMAVIFGLNNYFLRWNKELDARTSIVDPETKNLVSIGTPSEHTARPLPPPILVCSDNEVVVKQLSRQYHIGNDRLRKLAQQVWQMTQNVEVKFEWVPRKENPAGNMLK